MVFCDPIRHRCIRLGFISAFTTISQTKLVRHARAGNDVQYYKIGLHGLCWRPKLSYQTTIEFTVRSETYFISNFLLAYTKVEFSARKTNRKESSRSVSDFLFYFLSLKFWVITIIIGANGFAPHSRLQIPNIESIENFKTSKKIMYNE